MAETNMATLVEAIWREGSKSNTFEPRQQRQQQEIALTEEQIKDNILKTLQKDPSLFLERWGQLLCFEELSYFDQFEGDYEVQFYVKRYRQSLANEGRPNQKTIQNRRYKYMQKLMEGTYFEMEEMKQRNPTLFEYYIGQYETVQDKSNIKIKHHDKLSQLILFNYDCDARNQQRMEEKKKEEIEEFEESDEESFEPVKKDISLKERELFKNEFLTTMQQNFLSGKDEFNYDMIDFDEENDDWIQSNRDLEEQYFDED